MALTANREVDRFVDQELRSVAVEAGAHVLKGAFVEWAASGYARPLSGGGVFAGIAYEEMDNVAGGDGAVSGRVFTQGDFDLPLAGATQADMGRAVYASDDETLTFESTSNTYVGRVMGLAGNGRIILRLQTANT